MRAYEYEMSASDMPEYGAMGVEGLRDEAAAQWLRAEHAEKKLGCAEKLLDSLTVENRALESEIRMARGEVRTVLNNTEGAKLKAEQMRDEYMRRLEQPVEESWRREVETARRTAKYYKDGYENLCQVLLDIQKIARNRKRYELREVGE